MTSSSSSMNIQAMMHWYRKYRVITAVPKPVCSINAADSSGGICRLITMRVIWRISYRKLSSLHIRLMVASLIPDRKDSSFCVPQRSWISCTRAAEGRRGKVSRYSAFFSSSASSLRFSSKSKEQISVSAPFRPSLRYSSPFLLHCSRLFANCVRQTVVLMMPVLLEHLYAL